MKAIVLGSTGAVGTELTKELIAQKSVTQILLLNRRQHPVPVISNSPKVTQEFVDVFNPETYKHAIAGHDAAFSTFGVGEPSKISREQFIKTDLQAAIAFAKACKENYVRHFSSLGSVGADKESWIFYLKIKGQLEQALKDLKFDRLSLFQPSMILTPENRYGFSQGIGLKFYPKLDPILTGTWQKYRGIKVENLGKSMARNALLKKSGDIEILTWSEFMAVMNSEIPPLNIVV